MSDNCVTNPCQYFPPNASPKRVGAGTDRSAKASLDRPLLMKSFEQMDRQMSKVRNRLFDALMQSLFAFVKQNSLTTEMRENSFETKFAANTGLIPTILLSIGLNSSEHKFICELFVEAIEDLTSFVVYLNSRQTQNMASLLKQICDTVINENTIKSLSIDESQMKKQTFGGVFKICEQYIHRSKSNKFCPPIVFFLDEIESFDHSLVAQLIHILKEYMQNIPFIIIMIQSNQTISLQHLLPSSATDFLIVHHFHSISGQIIIDEIIKELFIESSLAFKLGPNVLDFILTTFKDFDISIQSIMNFVKYSLFLHFYSNQLSFLCQTESKLKIYLKNNDMKLPKTSRESQFFDQSLSRKELNKNFIEKVSQFVSIHANFVNNLKLVFTLLEQNNSDITLTQFYLNASNGSQLKSLIKSLHRLTQNQWKTSLDKCLSQDLSNNGTEPLIALLKSSQTELNDIFNESNNLPNVLVERLDVSDLKSKLSNLKTRHQWKETINPSNKSKVLTRFDIWKNTTIDCIEKVFNELPNPLSSDLKPIFVFDDLESIKQNMFANVRSDVQKSLSNAISMNSKTTKQSKTDFHRIFQLYTESQSIINTFDFFTAFQQMSQSLEPLNQKRKRTKEETNEEMIVRFMNAVSNLEYIGLIQSAKHKADHLTRLVWF